MPLFFDANHLPTTANEYVAWVDIMGTQSSMSRSLKVTANFVFKLHLAALQALVGDVTVYPVMDGFYAASPSKLRISEFIRSVYAAVAEEFNNSENRFRFMIRGGLAFGPVVHGRDVPEVASRTLHQHPNYRQSVLLGMPMVQAHLSESLAPPFGLAVHESARAFAPTGQEPFHHAWWRWDNPGNQQLWTTLRDSLDSHLDWSARRALRIGYSPERITVHKNMVAQMFELMDG